MVLTVKKSSSRGHADNTWLHTKYSFSFANYFNKQNMLFGCLRVLNEDKVSGFKGFDLHPHENMEIFTYVLSGKLEHKDSLDHGAIIGYGDVQYMSAGSGILHAEKNPKEGEVHLLQIWILPKVLNTKPEYNNKFYSVAEKTGKLLLIASPNAKEDSLPIKQDAEIYASILQEKHSIEYTFTFERKIYIHVATGSIHVNELELIVGDAVAIENETTITLKGSKEGGEFLLFNMAEYKKPTA
ncbi:Quercetin 2,3-dioxygenase [Candidatus Hepatincola sp. Av]